MQRNNSRRATYQVDSLLSVKQQQLKRARHEHSGGGGGGSNGHSNGTALMSGTNTNGVPYGDFLTLVFLGFHDKTLADDGVLVEVETYLSHVPHQKRKDGIKTQQERVGLGFNHYVQCPTSALY